MTAIATCPAYCQLGFADIDQILDIEQQVYSHPWSRGNFTDSFLSAHDAFGFRNSEHQLFAYFLMMPVMEELHLLNLAVGAEYQGQGYARQLISKMFDYAARKQAESILLEVRCSNQRAIDVYLKAGFSEIGKRKSYYPAQGNTREDAIVMRRMC